MLCIRFLIGLGLAFLCSISWALDLNLPSSPSANALSGLTSLTNSPGNSLNNPSLAYPGLEISTANLYQINEIKFHNLAVSTKYSKIFLNITEQYLGNELYYENQNTLNLGYTCKTLNFGIAGRYIFSQTENYANVNATLLDVATNIKFDRTICHLIIKNVTATKVSGLQLPVYHICEVSHQLNKTITLAVGVEKQNSQSPSFKFGTKYTLSKNCSILLSTQNEPYKIGTGLEIKVGKYGMHYSISTHSYLNPTHYVSLIYAL